MGGIDFGQVGWVKKTEWNNSIFKPDPLHSYPEGEIMVLRICILSALILTLALPNDTKAKSSTAVNMKEITDTVKDVCLTPSNKGKYWEANIKANGEAKVKLKLINPSLSGGVSFKKGEWEGVQQSLQAAENKDYRGCVNKLTPLFLEKFGPEEKVKKIKTEKSKYSFFVVPKSIEVSPGFSKTAIVKIVNNHDYPVYQTTLRIAVEKGDLSVDEIEVKPKDQPKIKSEIGGEEGKIIVFHDLLTLGLITNEGRRENHLILYDIDAHSTKEYFVKINASKMHQESKIVFQIIRTDKKPADIVSFDPFVFCKRDNSDFNTYWDVSKSMLGQKRYREALLCCEKALIKDPKSAKVYANMGIALLFLSETEKAAQAFEEAIRIDPSSTMPYLNLAKVLIKKQKYADAISKIKIILDRRDSDQAEALVLWGQCLAQQKDENGAIEKYKKAIEINTEFGPAYYQWGLLLKSNNNCEKAITKFQKSAEYSHPFRLKSYGMWGACLEKMGDSQEAINKYQAIIDLAPNSDEAKVSRKSIEIANKKLQNIQAK